MNSSKTIIYFSIGFIAVVYGIALLASPDVATTDYNSANNEQPHEFFNACFIYIVLISGILAVCFKVYPPWLSSIIAIVYTTPAFIALNIPELTNEEMMVIFIAGMYMLFIMYFAISLLYIITFGVVYNIRYAAILLAVCIIYPLVFGYEYIILQPLLLFIITLPMLAKYYKLAGAMIYAFASILVCGVFYLSLTS